MRKGRVTGRQADRCYDCNHMRRYHRAGEVVDTCSRCHGRHQTQNRAAWAHKFVEPPPQLCGHPDDIIGPCTMPLGHDKSDDPLEQLHGVRGGRVIS